MTTLGLIRHGVTAWNQVGRSQGKMDIPLTDEGREQAQKLAKRLKDEKWDLIISSDLSRAKETADIIAKELEIPVVDYDKRVRERSFGEIEGTTHEERVAKWGEDWKQLDLGIEKDEDVIHRWETFLEEVTETYKGRNILVVSHGAFIGKALEKIGYNRLDNPLRNCSVTVVTNTSEGLQCSLYNCTKHFDE